MQRMSGRPRGRKRLARALGLDGNPLRRATDRAEAWIRIGLVAVFLVAGPPDPPADPAGPIRARIDGSPLTAAAALAWSGDLPRLLQQVLFDTADSIVF
jgi:hypothetical protein